MCSVLAIVTDSMMSLWWGVLCVAACGDNVHPVGDPLRPAAALTIVAHQDDDLLFMQPDLHDAVRGGLGVTNVYVTAGNASAGVDAAERRDQAIMVAYGSIAGDNDWSCGWIEIAGHAAEHCRLESAQLSLVFLGYPDGLRHAENHQGLLQLWEGKVKTVSTVARVTTKYDQPGLIAALAEIIDITAPRTLRTLEIAATHGDDHPDHMLVGALAVLATAASSQAPELISYRGYPITGEPANNSLVVADSLDAFAHYDACASDCGRCGAACLTDRLEAGYVDMLQRHYAIGMRRAASGELHLGDGCVTVTSVGEPAAVGDCASAPPWQLDDRGELRSSTGLCLQVMVTGEVLAVECGGRGPGERFFLDEEGHLWSGIVPAPEDDMATAHLYCVGAAGNVPHAGLCGEGRAPTLELAPTAHATQRDSIAITATGRAVRIAMLPSEPLPMLCAIEAGLECAPGASDGGLLPAIQIGSAGAPLVIDPESLMLGDVDGDARMDACGRDADGIVCATAASGYLPARWTPLFRSRGAADSMDRSLAITADGEICGLGEPGVVCTSRGATSFTDVRSTWPDPSAELWIADLDGDGQADWCTATTGGVACGLASDRDRTTDGVPWSYAFHGVAEASLADGTMPSAATAAFTDIDGDGRADLCAARAGAIACARSLGHGFGPFMIVARLPPGMVPTSLWAESTAVSGREPRICAADATAIACVH